MEWTMEEVARVADLAAEGLSGEEIGQALGRSRSAVFRKLRRIKRGDQMPNPNQFHWDETALARIRGLYAENYTFSQIAAAIGCTRNAAIGKAHRLGLNGREPYKTPPKPSRTEAQQRAAKDWGTRQRLEDRAERQAKSQRPPRAMPTVCEDAPISKDLTFERLSSATCKWPHGDSAPFTFCGHQSFGLRYCAYHERKSTAPRLERAKEVA